MSTLLIRLAGPMQSWGFDSKYDIRRTDNIPTKSGVIGLLASALGRQRGESLEDLVSLKFGVRVDSPGRIYEDFQITNMGGKLNPNLSRRQYIMDAVFLAGVESDDEEYLKSLEYALQNPAFPLYLGRRSCPPTQPISLGIKKCGLYEALSLEPWSVSEFMKKRSHQTLLRIITDGEGGGIVRRDVPVSFSSYVRVYRYRLVQEQLPKIIRDKGGLDITETEHDPMAELR